MNIDGRLAALVEKQMELEAEVDSKEAELSDAKSRLAKIAEKELPDLMEEFGLEDFKTKEGMKVTVKDTIRASIKKENKAAAFQWLRDQGFDSLIKRKIEMQFGKGEESKATEVRDQLMKDGYSVKDDSSVHASTLSSFVREQLEAGETIPMELLGVFKQRKAKIKS